MSSLYTSLRNEKRRRGSKVGRGENKRKEILMDGIESRRIAWSDWKMLQAGMCNIMPIRERGYLRSNRKRTFSASRPKRLQSLQGRHERVDQKFVGKVDRRETSPADSGPRLQLCG